MEIIIPFTAAHKLKFFVYHSSNTGTKKEEINKEMSLNTHRSNESQCILYARSDQESERIGRREFTAATECHVCI